MKQSIAFLQFVMQNYQYWWPGPEQWTDKKGRHVVTEKQMYKAFAEQQYGARLLVRPEIKEPGNKG